MLHVLNYKISFPILLQTQKKLFFFFFVIDSVGYRYESDCNGKKILQIFTEANNFRKIDLMLNNNIHLDIKALTVVLLLQSSIQFLNHRNVHLFKTIPLQFRDKDVWWGHAKSFTEVQLDDIGWSSPIDQCTHTIVEGQLLIRNDLPLVNHAVCFVSAPCLACAIT